MSTTMQSSYHLSLSTRDWISARGLTIIFWLCINGCVVTSSVFAQGIGNDTQLPTTSGFQQISNLPSAGLGQDGRVFAPARIFSKPNASSVTYDLKERSAPKPTPPALNTVAENKTTNQNEANKSGASTDPALGFQYDFASLVRQSTGNTLPVFGAQLLSGSISQQAVDPLTVPSDYRIGPGDELLIRAWGQIDIDFQGAVDRSGGIFLPKIGSIIVAGQKFSDLRQLLQTTIGKQYKGFELTVSLGALRQIQYYVTGFAKQTGIHTTESTATALHGLMTAGGVSSEGDLRHIELRRGDASPLIIDAYEFLAHGKRTQDPQLLPGDVLHVPAAKGFVAVAGNVRRAAIYHMGTNMHVADALELAGGVALGQGQISIRRERLKTASDINNNEESSKRIVEVLGSDPESLAQPVQDGDLLIVLPVSPRFEQTVTLRGNVAQPLRHPHQMGMRVSDLLNLSQSFVRPAVWVERQSRNSLEALSRRNRDTELLNDFPDVNWSYAAIERFDPKTQAMHVLPFHLGRALAKDPTQDLVLEPQDVLVVFAKTDFRQPETEMQRLVKIEGEVRSPGFYPIKPNDTLPDLIAKAGGLTERAYVFGTFLSRMQSRKTESAMLKEAADRIEQDYFRYLASRARNSVGQEDASVSSPELEAIKTLVQRLRTTEPEGRIALGLKNGSASLQNLPPLVLEDQDNVTIPARPSTVAVMGAVFRQGSLMWQPSKSALYYLENSGSLPQYADKSALLIFRADGTVRQTSSSLLTGWLESINPGDTIMVPEDVQSSSWTRTFRDWSQIFYQLGLGAAALKILKSSL